MLCKWYIMLVWWVKEKKVIVLIVSNLDKCFGKLNNFIYKCEYCLNDGLG